MTDYVKTMNIDEINQGMLLALKLLSKISPDIRSPASTKRTRSQSSKTLFSRVGRSKNHKDVAEGQEKSIPVSSNDGQHSNSQKDCKRGNEESSSIQLCVAKSTAFFHAFVRHRIMPWLSDNAIYNAGTNECLVADDSDVHEHSNEETQSSKKPTEATCVLTFAASCRYLVELACFPCWESTAEIDETKNYSKFHFYFIISFNILHSYINVNISSIRKVLLIVSMTGKNKNGHCARPCWMKSLIFASSAKWCSNEKCLVLICKMSYLLILA